MRANVTRTKLAVLAACAGLFLAAAPVWAHHAFAAEFDATKPVKLRGKVTKVELINPHSWIPIDVVGPDGKGTKWMGEGEAPNALIRRDFNKVAVPVAH